MCTGMIALVFFVIFRASSFTSMFKVAGSTSTKTGLAPVNSTMLAVAAKVMGAMKDERHLKWINRTLGGAFVAAGVALASFRRAAMAAA